MANNFVQAVKDMHEKMKNAGSSAPQSGQPSQKVIIANAVALIKRYPQLVLPRTGK